MNEPLLPRGILLAHGDMARGIIDAVRQITGIEEEVLVPLSNRGLSPATLADAVKSNLGAGPTILFTDLQSGSCGFAARMLGREIPGLIVISGVNLPVLLEFVMSRDLPMDELIPRLLNRGKAAIGCSSTGAEAHDRAVSRG